MICSPRNTTAATVRLRFAATVCICAIIAASPASAQSPSDIYSYASFLQDASGDQADDPPASAADEDDFASFLDDDEGDSGSGEAVDTSGPFISTRTLFVSNDLFNLEATAEFPVLGRMNVGEHNSPLPRDRTYAIYKHYDNALDTRVNDYSSYPLARRDRSIDQYLLGFEKTFHDKLASIELRMPLIASGNTGFDAGFGSDDANVGNLGIIGKRRFGGDDRNTFSIGAGVTVPTGDNTFFTVGDQTFEFQNDAVHLLPFVGWLKQTQSRRTFFISFATLDIPIGGNEVEFRESAAGGGRILGELDDQTTLYVDLSLGHWLHRDPDNPLVTGWAVQAELHYAGSLNSAETLSGTLSGGGWNTQFEFCNTRKDFHQTLAAIMLHAELSSRTDIRVAGLFPMTSADERFFDSELIVAIIQRY